MPAGAVTLVIRQYTDLICALEAQLDHTIINTTVVLMHSQYKAARVAHGLHPTELVANIAAWATWPAVHHMQLSQVVVARVTQLTHPMPVGAVLAQVALLE